jgi:hypothetical protein
MEPAHTWFGVMTLVMTSMPKNKMEVQWVFVVSHRYSVGTVTAMTATPCGVRPLAGRMAIASTAPMMRAIR